MSTPVRRAEASDLRGVVEILGDAFEDDPVMRWVTRKASYPRYAFALTLPVSLPYGLTHIASDGTGAVSWLPPRVELDSPISAGVVWKGLTQYGPGSLLRALSTLSLIREHHPKEEHYYLFAIGTLRSSRGRGVGSALIRQGLARCDDEQKPAYLESSNADNLPFYRRHGFEVIDEVRLPRKGPAMYLMWRVPR